MALQSKIMTITPAQATAWLDANKFDNRNVSDRNVAKIVRDIKADKWVFDGTPIRFDSAGNILDGQHRLWAIVMANKPCESVIVTGLEEKAKLVIDTGKSRTSADVLHFAGHKNATSLGAALRLSIGWKVAKKDLNDWAHNQSHKRLSTQELLDEATKMPILGQIVSRINSLKFCKKFIGVGTASFAYHLLNKYTTTANGILVDEFFTMLETGVNLAPESPILVLRDTLSMQGIKLFSGNAGAKNSSYKIALIIKAWNAWIAKKKVKSLYFNGEKESYPEIK